MIFQNYRFLSFVIILSATFVVLGGILFSAHAAEIKGKVSAISGDVVTIQIPPGPVPQVGDKVDIGFAMPNGNTISIGTWRVIKAKGQKIRAAVKEAFGDPDVGMSAKISTKAQPSKAPKSTLVIPSESSRTTSDGKRESFTTEIPKKQSDMKSENEDGSLAKAQREIQLERKRIQEEQRRLQEERKSLEAERKRIAADRQRMVADQKRLAATNKLSNEPKKHRGIAPPPEKKAPSVVAKLPKNLSLPKMIKGKDGASMLYVPAGEFTRGDTFKEGEEDERPVRKIYLDAFYIDKYPVTNRLYINMTGDKEIQGAEDSPVKDIAWEDAKSYCEKAGKRLPTEAEWEKAARGTDGRRYPWGNTWDESKIIWLPNSLGTQPVNRSYKTHQSPFGVVDMAGNISEWVSDWYQDDYYKFAPKRNPKGPSRSDILQRHVVRGGSYLSGDPKSLRNSARGWAMPLAPKIHVGFRCAKAAK